MEKVRKAIDEGNSHWIEAFNKADATLLASLFLDDGMILGNDGGISRGRKAIQERMEEVMHGIGPASATVSTTNLWVIGDTAYETGEYAYSVHVEGKNTVISSGKYVVVWKRTTNGSWKIYVDIGMPND